MLLAAQIGLDKDKFKADLDSGKYKTVVDKDEADGETVAVRNSGFLHQREAL